MIWYATVALAGGAVGYTLGRLKPLHRALDWANWQSYRTNRPTGLRYAAMFTLLSAENLGWIISHPAQARNAWKHRNDPPPPRSPAVQIDPNWVANRQAAAEREEQGR